MPEKTVILCYVFAVHFFVKYYDPFFLFPVWYCQTIFKLQDNPASDYNIGNKVFFFYIGIFLCVSLGVLQSCRLTNRQKQD